jgi:hypothetical protein
MPLTFVTVLALLGFLVCGNPSAVVASGMPEDVLRAVVQANANRDLASMARHMAQESDVIGYTIGGRKYVGWRDFSRDLENEFRSVTRLEIPIRELKVWHHDTVAWFAMELDYIRYVSDGDRISRSVLPLRETGVLERRGETWTIVAWHESLRSETFSAAGPSVSAQPVSAPESSGMPDVSGEWEIQEEDKSYRATLDRNGNGSYTWQGGRIATTGVINRTWQGTWQQPGNDREGGFELLLSEDGADAKGVWWYTRVGDRTNIPPRQWGGSYVWKRLSSGPPSTSTR